MSFDTSYHVLSLATLGFITLATFLHSFRNRPVPTMKSLSFVLFTVALEFSNQVGWWKMIKIAFPLAVISIGGVLLAWVLVIAYVQRKLILWTEEHSDVAKSLLGRPLLFPTRLTHSRMFPEKYNYWINYFLVGIPVGLRGHIGSLMAIDSDATSPHSQSKSFFRSLITKVLRKLLWFRVDPSLYLHRGDGHLGLVAKLESFLKEQVSSLIFLGFEFILIFPGRGSRKIPIRLSCDNSCFLMVDQKPYFLLVSLLATKRLECDDLGGEQLIRRKEECLHALNPREYPF